MPDLRERHNENGRHKGRPLSSNSTNRICRAYSAAAMAASSSVRISSTVLNPATR
jgi:hypothetical protein